MYLCMLCPLYARNDCEGNTAQQWPAYQVERNGQGVEQVQGTEQYVSAVKLENALQSWRYPERGGQYQDQSQNYF